MDSCTNYYPFRFLHNSGYELIFVDVIDSTVDMLNEGHKYAVTEISSEGEKQSTVDHFKAINSKDDPESVVKEIAKADTVTCAVGPNILKFIAPLIAKGINARPKDLKPVSVIACENAINATSTLAEFIRPGLSDEVKASIDNKVRFANCAVDRIVPQQAATQTLDVRIEKFYEWCVEENPFDGVGRPPIEGVHYVKDLTPYIERKLYTVNTAHATAAYFGYAAKKHLIHEAMADKNIKAIVRGAIKETSNLIIQKHHIPRAEQEEYAEKIIARISNPALEDQVERVGRAPLRKLSRNERLVGPASQLAEMGESCTYLLGAIEKAFEFQNVGDDQESHELGRIMSTLKPAEVVEKVCGLTPKDKIYPAIVDIVTKVQEHNQHRQQKPEGHRMRSPIMAEI